jgi:hypothetical protein
MDNHIREWMVDQLDTLPMGGIILIKDHPAEDGLIRIGKELIDNYGSSFINDEGFELLFADDYSYITKKEVIAF